MSETKKAIATQGPPMTFVGLWNEDKVFGPEGAVLEVLDSAFYPVLTHERWVMHNNMWTFVPTESGLL